MGKLILSLLILAVTVSSSSAQFGKIGEVFKKKGKGDKGNKDIGVEVTDDEKGISGIYYVWQPSTTEDGWFRKISQVAIQYDPSNGKMVFHKNKKESVEYYTAGYIKTEKLEETCGIYAFRNNYGVPNLWTTELGMFMYRFDADVSMGCEFNKFRFGRESFLMSKDKELIEGMTDDKYKEILKAQTLEGCNCSRNAKAGKYPPPARKMKDAATEKAILEVLMQRVKREGWTEEILGVYSASEGWGNNEIWVSSNKNNAHVAKHMNIVILMKKGGNCHYQRMTVAKDKLDAIENGEFVDGKEVKGITIVGVVPENKPLSCEKAAELLK